MAALIVGYGFSRLPSGAVGLVTNDGPPDEEVRGEGRDGDGELLGSTGVAGTLPAMSRTASVPVFSRVT